MPLTRHRDAPLELVDYNVYILDTIQCFYSTDQQRGFSCKMIT
jgi:hypothetical protein